MIERVGSLWLRNMILESLSGYMTKDLTIHDPI